MGGSEASIGRRRASDVVTCLAATVGCPWMGVRSVAVRRARLAARREALGLTQEALAERLGVELSTVGRWERGAQLPQPPMRLRLAAVLGVSIDELGGLLRADGPRDAGAVEEDVRGDQLNWLRTRQAQGVRGRELSELAAWLYPADQRAPGGHVLAGPGWLLDRPAELDSVRLVFANEVPTPPRPTPMDHVLPLAFHGKRYSSYARAVRDLVRPRLLENRLSYRLVDVSAREHLALTFGTTTFFEVFDVKQPVAHEFKAAWLASDRSIPAWDVLPLRSQIGDPFDPTRLVLSPGISTLTIRKDLHGDHRFVLHERDGGKVADGGGLCHVMPAGEFQPSSVSPVDLRNDFSLWRNIMREYSEEFLGDPEHDGGASGPIDYAAEEPFRSFDRARAQGSFRLWHYGLVMEPLELGAAQLTVAVIDGDVFDNLFAKLVETNDEGHIVGAGGRRDIPFTVDAIDRLEPRLSASALTLLRLAWRDRGQLL